MGSSLTLHLLIPCQFMKDFDSQKIDILMLAFFNEMMIVLKHTILIDKFYISQFSLKIKKKTYLESTVIS